MRSIGASDDEAYPEQSSVVPFAGPIRDEPKDATSPRSRGFVGELLYSMVAAFAFNAVGPGPVVVLADCIRRHGCHVARLLRAGSPNTRRRR
jgi:hypothetical protein